MLCRCCRYQRHLLQVSRPKCLVCNTCAQRLHFKVQRYAVCYSLVIVGGVALNDAGQSLQLTLFKLLFINYMVRNGFQAPVWYELHLGVLITLKDPTAT